MAKQVIGGWWESGWMVVDGAQVGAQCMGDDGKQADSGGQWVSRWTVDSGWHMMENGGQWWMDSIRWQAGRQWWTVSKGVHSAWGTMGKQVDGGAQSGAQCTADGGQTGGGDGKGKCV